MTATKIFRIDPSRALEQIVRINARAIRVGVRFSGNDRVGSFAGKARGHEIAGDYRVDGAQLTVTLTTHPTGFFANANAVFKQIEKWLR